MFDISTKVQPYYALFYIRKFFVDVFVCAFVGARGGGGGGGGGGINVIKDWEYRKNNSSTNYFWNPQLLPEFYLHVCVYSIWIGQ